MLEYTGVSSGRMWFRFKRYDDATRYYIRYRESDDGGRAWGEWNQTQEYGITTGSDGYTAFTMTTAAGRMYETYVVLTGDEKDPSPESNIVTVIYPNEPPQPPPVIDGFPFYINGKPVPVLKPLEIPTGVSSWLIWYREFGNTEWISLGTVSGGIYAILETTFLLPEHTYQFIIAWYDNTNQKIISDISNVVTIALPSANIGYLLPPRALQSYYYGEYNDKHWNILLVQRGDMRAVNVAVDHKRSTEGTWVSDGDLVISEQAVAGGDTERKTYFIQHGFNTAIEGEQWQYRLRNKADGLETSEYSDIFSVTIPLILPRLPSPAVTLQQEAQHVLIGLGEVEDSIGYKIERRSTSDSNWTVIQAALSPTIRSYADTGTSYGNTYFYRVTALGDGNTYQDSNPTEQSITITQYVTLPAPVIDSVVELGISVQITISNINAPNTDQVKIEMSENGGAWRQVAWGYPASHAETSFTTTIPGESILEGGELRFRAYATPAAMARENSPYSEIASINIAEREWLLRWNGSSWDDPSGITGGWVNQNVTWSDSSSTYTEVSNITETTPAGTTGVKRLEGGGWYRTVNPLIANQGNIATKYSRICMVGSLVKYQDGTDNHAWFGVAYTYSFGGGTQFDTSHGSYVFAGSESGSAAAGTKVDPYFSPRASSSYAGKQGPYLFFRFHYGYADVKGIYAIKR